MKKSILTLAGTMIMTGAFLSTTTVYGSDENDKHGNNHDKDELACYKWDIFPDERFKLDIKKHSPLSERKEEHKFGHAKQTAFSVHGKHVLHDWMATVEGTVVTAAPSNNSSNTKSSKDTGAHLGLLAKWVRGNGNHDFARSVTLDCTTSEVSSAPKTWHCESRNEFNVYHGFSKLTWVDETKDPACSIFQNGKGRGADSLPDSGSMMEQQR
ncbi:hypothetical protein [Nitrosomonas sp. Nm166]|uniref:hypothetical protein n=1 Tax=Nitrosomonas sp. Nm166 TaxID=1881054 RepID=UPI0008E01140|nr:hypothetical protein [Nitrosomonas sp. Nm166]SFE02137.1 hypothetical protein SAMN05428977_10055 [Nitrosomonas sp. Nm166]